MGKKVKNARAAGCTEPNCNLLYNSVQPQDSWSSITDQYTDGSGHPSFTGSVDKGVFQDTSTPPTGVGQSQLAAEADAFASSQSITDTTDAQIVIATQSGTCPQGFWIYTEVPSAGTRDVLRKPILAAQRRLPQHGCLTTPSGPPTLVLNIN